jgi:hypothetical protein
MRKRLQPTNFPGGHVDEDRVVTPALGLEMLGYGLHQGSLKYKE